MGRGVASGPWEKAWGVKARHGKTVAPLCDLLAAHFDRVREDAFVPYARMATACLTLALLDAEDEVKADPDALGPEQHALLVAPTDSAALDMIALHCEAIGIDVAWFRDFSSSTLDRIADQVRAQRESPAADVVSLSTARQRRRREAEVDQAQFVHVPVLSHGGRMVGSQLAWVC